MIRIPNRMVAYLEGSQAAAEPVLDSDKGRLIKLLRRTRPRSDGARYLHLGSDEKTLLRQEAHDLATAAAVRQDTADGRADLNAATATIRQLDKDPR